MLESILALKNTPINGVNKLIIKTDSVTLTTEILEDDINELWTAAIELSDGKKLLSEIIKHYLSGGYEPDEIQKIVSEIINQY